MIHLLNKEISDCTIALQQPNKAIDNYRCYWEGRQALAEELLLKLQQTQCTKLLPLARLYSFAETLAKGDHEWRYSDEDQLWHKDGWVSRTTDELMQLFPERL